MNGKTGNHHFFRFLDKQPHVMISFWWNKQVRIYQSKIQDRRRNFIDDSYCLLQLGIDLKIFFVNENRRAEARVGRSFGIRSCGRKLFSARSVKAGFRHFSRLVLDISSITHTMGICVPSSLHQYFLVILDQIIWKPADGRIFEKEGSRYIGEF